MARNRYGGFCYRCGKWVDPGQGHYERYQGGWRTQHADCCLKARELRQRVLEELEKRALEAKEKP